MFVPLKNCRYMFDAASGTAHFSANLSDDWLATRIMRRLPEAFIPAPDAGKSAIRSRESVHCLHPGNPSSADLQRLAELHLQLRRDLYYINGTEHSGT